jgi:predicted DNA-binding protein (MmcQ/YjbR family)/alkylated DNA nucleotide flippase Atl1
MFLRMRWNRGKMEKYGFAGTDGGLVFMRDFMDGDFTAEVTVHSNGSTLFRVIDRMNEEEYAQLNNPVYNGAFVNTVRSEYEELLADIAANCCDEADFASDQSIRIAGRILKEYGVSPDFPWDDNRYSTAGVFRHKDSGKWFGLIMNIDRRLLDKTADEKQTDVMNLKADETKVSMLHRIPGIYPAYHMNHAKWISVVLDDTLADGTVLDLIDISFRLTSGGGGVLNEQLIMQVLDIADHIPPGTVMSYGQIAAAIGKPNNSRLVGKIMSMADRYGEHPCHRVVNHAGRTVPGWTEQRAMLEAEGVTFLANGCVDMKKHNVI